MVERGLAKYAVGQLERGSDRKAPSQYFVQMERSRRLAHMRTVICDRSHWEPMYGSVAQARAYATKEDTSRRTLGVRPYVVSWQATRSRRRPWTV